jgi:ribose-phosphate pyrophosphokinase
MIKVNGQIPKVINFPDGTFKINTPFEIASHYDVLWKYENESELIILMYVIQNLKEKGNSEIELYIPYLPNARMDRVHKSDEVFTLKYFCKLINMLEVDRVKVLDVHSAVSAALLDRAVNISPEAYIDKAVRDAGIDPKKDYIFFPDEGSCKRYSECFRNFSNIGFGIKKRNWEDGKIIGLDIIGENPAGKNVFIVDDICSYGGTVYHSSKKLKELGCGKIYVYFTHCENSIAKGKLFEDDMIERVYTTNSICTLDCREYPRIKFIDCENGAEFI